MLRIDFLPPQPGNTHLEQGAFNNFLDSTMNFHFSARLAGRAIGSTIITNDAAIEAVPVIAQELINEHVTGVDGSFAPMSEWPALAESFMEGIQAAISYAHAQQHEGVTV